MGRQRIGRWLLFLGCLFCLGEATHAGYAYLVGASTYGGVGKVNAVMQNRLDSEMTIWGASTALVHFDVALVEEAFGFAAYNMGIDGTSFDQYHGLLEEYLAYSSKGRHLVLAFDVNGLRQRTAVYQLHNWLHHLNNERIYKSIAGMDPLLTFKARHLPLYSLTLMDKHGFFHARRGLGQVMGLGGQGADFGGGFVPMDREWEAPDEASDVTISVSQQLVDRVGGLCEVATSRGFEVWLVATPCYVAGQERIRNLDLLPEALRSLRTRGGRVLNFLESDLCQSKELFYNNTHLNRKGAKRFTAEFAEAIRAQSETYRHQR